MRPRTMAAAPEITPSSTDLTPYVPRVVVDWVRGEPDARRRELEGTLAFVDISGFTAMSERLAQKGKLGAEEVTEVMQIGVNRGRVFAGEVGAEYRKTYTILGTTAGR
jgi:class 3 adenylate cyclase